MSIRRLARGFALGGMHTMMRHVFDRDHIYGPGGWCADRRHHESVLRAIRARGIEGSVAFILVPSGVAPSPGMDLPQLNGKYFSCD